ncbi:hypothetical protein HELRODRAFT_183744 [Helobdella robusta]|uniref:G-protein coupled receptors family 1 profile domain-containing protein n=1 Tax=Helobdella robusta TaxID=6412 RepID=T1FK47_HELRO|nr:hypothetical protein HELRODRAFT_183744 [Helobdella robusta]ESO10329.1 hypothetical protein HELRODRAFT_183744 [Helobdella robusta]
MSEKLFCTLVFVKRNQINDRGHQRTTSVKNDHSKVSEHIELNHKNGCSFSATCVFKSNDATFSAEERKPTKMGNGADELLNRPISTDVSTGNQNENCSNKTTVKKSVTVQESLEDVKTKRQVIKMLLMVVILFTMCWSPTLIESVLAAFDIGHRLNFGPIKHARQAFALLSYFNSCLNPIVYGFMLKNFRNSFKIMMCHSQCCQKQSCCCKAESAGGDSMRFIHNSYQNNNKTFQFCYNANNNTNINNNKNIPTINNNTGNNTSTLNNSFKSSIKAHISL